MKSLTVHNMEPELARAIEALAARTGLSQNKVVKKLLRKALGLGSPQQPKTDFSAFCGLWSEEEGIAFDQAVKDFEEIDEDLWK